MESELESADTFYKSNDIEVAIKHYNKYLDQGDDISSEKKFYAHLRLGQCYKKLSKEPEMLYHCTTAYQICPTRAESLYELITFYKNKLQHYKAIIYYKAAKDIKCPDKEELGMDPSIYLYKIAYEHTIIAYYVGERQINSTFMQIFRAIPANELWSIFFNYKFYCPILESPLFVKCFNNSFTEEVGGATEKFLASSPCIFNYQGGYAMNQRYVSYKIRPNGSYEYNKYIATINHFMKLSPSFDIEYTIKLPTKERTHTQYIGIEDVKIISINGELCYTGTCCNSKNKIGICGGRYNIDSQNSKLEYNEYHIAGEKSCEKNWVYIPNVNFHDKSKRMVYKWRPLTICQLNEDGMLKIIEEKPMPVIFDLAKGTSNGFLYNNEIWFVVHFSHDYCNELRQYYHSLAVFDTEMNILRYTLPFKFTDNPIEYCLGIIVESERIILSHSILDRESYIRVYTKETLDKLFIYP